MPVKEMVFVSKAFVANTSDGFRNTKDDLF